MPLQEKTTLIVGVILFVLCLVSSCIIPCVVAMTQLNKTTTVAMMQNCSNEDCHKTVCHNGVCTST